mmetsp:Transcript_11145/g.36692  ORF Transcript_11145/g.36692 Transcript_11145/m.36692 type:complete len:246 (+) Transcript_11145:267-1004(+)
MGNWGSQQQLGAAAAAAAAPVVVAAPGSLAAQPAQPPRDAPSVSPTRAAVPTAPAQHPPRSAEGAAPAARGSAPAARGSSALAAFLATQGPAPSVQAPALAPAPAQPARQPDSYGPAHRERGATPAASAPAPAAPAQAPATAPAPASTTTQQPPASRKKSKKMPVLNLVSNSADAAAANLAKHGVTVIRVLGGPGSSDVTGFLRSVLDAELGNRPSSTPTAQLSDEQVRPAPPPSRLLRGGGKAG